MWKIFPSPPRIHLIIFVDFSFLGAPDTRRMKMKKNATRRPRGDKGCESVCVCVCVYGSRETLTWLRWWRLRNNIHYIDLDFGTLISPSDDDDKVRGGSSEWIDGRQWMSESVLWIKLWNVSYASMEKPLVSNLCKCSQVDLLLFSMRSSFSFLRVSRRRKQLSANDVTKENPPPMTSFVCGWWTFRSTPTCYASRNWNSVPFQPEKSLDINPSLTCRHSLPANDWVSCAHTVWRWKKFICLIVWI